nr:hypothetical protein [uncultured Butyrivibrio sp.]
MISEAEVQTRVYNDPIVQEGISNALLLDGELEYIREDPYINGITADFTLVRDNKIEAIIECKAGNINVTDYVRGIGQLLQYDYYGETKLPHKSFDYSDDFRTVFFFPATVLSDNSFNIAKFKYPKSTIILELNESSNAVRKITQKELSELDAAENDNLVTISPYYFRDNRIFEYYILLKHLLFKNQLGYEKLDRKEEEKFLVQTQTINNGNWRNAFITVSNLGLIDSNNIPSEAGKHLALLDYGKFAVTMYHSYVEPYYEALLEAFGGDNRMVASNQEIASRIREQHKDRDVLYLTQSSGRYISSWMNILRDDYGIVSFAPRSNDKTLVYNPNELNDVFFEKKVSENSVAKEYINKYLELMRKGMV